jgi:hypothetical protein
MAEPNGAAPAPAGSAGGGLGQAWRAALDAHARYYEAWGQLASRWMHDLADASREARLPSLPSLPPLRLTTGPSNGSPGSHPTAAMRSAAAAAPAEPPAPAVLVLEGVTGDVAAAAFLVENSLPHPVEGVVEVEHFEDLDGVAVLVRLDFDPAVISLAPGERRLVKVRVQLPQSLPANVDCRSTIRVQGVPGTTIPIRLRRVGD